EEHVGSRERQYEKNPCGRIEDACLRIREPRLARRVVRVPQREMEVPYLVGRKVMERLEVVGVIAERQHFAAKERTREHREREKRNECEREPAIHHRAQKSCTISRISRTP